MRGIIAALILRILLRHPAFYLVGEVREEIMIKDYRYSRERMGIQTVPFENPVNVGPVARQFLCQPAYRTLLPFEFIPYRFPDMFHLPIIEPDGFTIKSGIQIHKKTGTL